MFEFYGIRVMNDVYCLLWGYFVVQDFFKEHTSLPEMKIKWFIKLLKEKSL